MPPPLDEIVSAARRCFAQYGVDKTTMQDVAREAGIGRTGVYRLGVTRQELTEAAILARLRELGQQIRPIATRDAPFPEVLTDTSVATVDIARSDPELQHLLATTESMSLHRLLTSHTSMMQAFVLDLFGPMLARARKRKEIRADIDDDRIIEWLRAVYLMLLLREDLSAAEERALVEDFVLPSVVRRR
jgi:AcrR family transcriptional regulator